MRFDYLKPTTVEEVISVLGKYDGKAKVLAGGTDLMVQMRARLMEPEYVVDISNIPALDYIDYDRDKGLSVGAMTTLRAIEKSTKLTGGYSLLSQTAGSVGSVAIRNIGTIGGNLCQDTKCLEYTQTHTWGLELCHRAGGDACHAVKGAKRCSAMAIADTAPALVCLDAKLRVYGQRGERIISIDDFFIASGVVDLKYNEMVTAIEVPMLPAHTKGVYLKHCLRGPVDFSIASVAVALTASKGICENVRIGLLGVARTPVRAHQAEEILRGQKIDEALIEKCAQKASDEASPVSERGVIAADKKQMIKTLTADAIKQLRNK